MSNDFWAWSIILAKIFPKLSDLCLPLGELIQEKNQWLRTEAHDQALESIKQAVSDTPVLSFFDLVKPMTIQCNASTAQLGATLLRREQPLAYLSRA